MAWEEREGKGKGRGKGGGIPLTLFGKGGGRELNEGKGILDKNDIWQKKLEQVYLYANKKERECNSRRGAAAVWPERFLHPFFLFLSTFFCHHVDGDTQFRRNGGGRVGKVN